MDEGAAAALSRKALQIAIAEADADLARLLEVGVRGREVTLTDQPHALQHEQIAALAAVAVMALLQHALGARDPPAGRRALARREQREGHPERAPRGADRVTALQTLLM